MLNKSKHQVVMASILRDMYIEPALGPLLGFKGGTCAYFFYGLPRFSVDLDFDWLGSANEKEQETALQAIKRIASLYGTIKESYIKNFTIFILLSYGEQDRNIKIEISRRLPDVDMGKRFVLKEYFGISMLVATKPNMFASKLVALTNRPELVTRDIFDIDFFFKQLWDIDEEIITVRGGKPLKEYLTDCITAVKSVKENELLAGLGELVDEKQKDWVKSKMIPEVLFQLQNYQASLTRK